MSTTLKILLVVLVFGALIFASYEFGVIPSDEPPITATVILRNPLTGQQASGEVSNENGAAAATAIGATLFGVEMNQHYEVEFIVDYNATPDTGTPDLFGDVEMFGSVEYQETGHSFYNYGKDTASFNVEDTPLTAPDYEGTASFTKPNAYWDSVYDGSTIENLRGAHLDGSVWIVTITTSTAYAGTNAYYGQIEATITLDVDTDGNVNINLGDVDMTATEA